MATRCRRSSLAFLLLVVALLAAPSAAAAYEAVKVTTTLQEVHGGVAPGGPVIGRVYAGQVYVRVDTQGHWSRLWFDGRTGWVRTSTLEKTRHAVRQAAAPRVPARVEPAAGARAAGSAPRGSWWAVAAAGPGAWIKVHFGGRARWMDGSALARPGVPTFVDLGWRRDVVGDGTVWYRRHFADLSGGPQMVNLLYVNPARARVRPVAATRPTRTSDLAGRAGAFAAVNGTFFSRRADGTVSPTLYFKVGGRLLNVVGRPNAPVLGMDGGLDLWWRYRPGTWAGVPDAIGSVGELVEDGEAVARDGDPAVNYYWGRNPRTAMGLTGPGRLVLLTVDGRSTRSLGMTVSQLAALMLRVGCEQAGNLDGGGSTTMWLRSQGVVNYPSDDGVWGHAGERAVANCLAVFRRGE